jgi:hypothetical protein
MVQYDAVDDNKVAVLLEDLMAKFRTFGAGLEMMNERWIKVLKL